MFKPAHRRRSGVLIAVTAMLALSAVAAAPAGAEPRHHDDDGYQQLNLVSDVPGAAQLLDPNLVNAWGMSSSPTSPIWVSDNGSNISMLYRGATKPGDPVSAVALVVSIPGGGAPTGQVFNSTSDFVLPTGGPAAFIFAGEGGEISAWNGARPSMTMSPVPGTDSSMPSAPAAGSSPDSPPAAC